jgi:hypothetical protein
MKKEMKKATLADIIAKKQQGDMDKLNIKYFESKKLGMKIEVRKIPLKDFLKLSDIEDDESIEGMNELIYAMCPMFKENAKEAMELYGVGEATQLPSAVLEDDLYEMTKIIEVANSLYGLDKIDETVKNSSSKVMES